MRDFMTPFRYIAIVMLIIGISLINAAYEVKASANDMANTVFEPIRNMDINNPSSFNFNIDTDIYLNESITKTTTFMFDWIGFERDLVVGISAICLGFGLFFSPSFWDERRFWSKVIDFFT